MKVTQMPPVRAANLVANSGNTAYGVDVIQVACEIKTQESYCTSQKQSCDTSLDNWNQRTLCTKPFFKIKTVFQGMGFHVKDTTVESAWIVCIGRETVLSLTWESLCW